VWGVWAGNETELAKIRVSWPQRDQPSPRLHATDLECHPATTACPTPAGLSPLHRDLCGKRASKALIALRVGELLRWISEGGSRQTLIQCAVQEWGVGESTYATLHAEATKVIRAGIDRERPDAIAEKLAVLEQVIQEAIKDRCWSAAIGGLSTWGKWVGAGSFPRGMG